ncbi:hypothetical protein [Nesterenkonia alba]|nr:hypothetical protein [Nesterenkonia alba]
MAEPETPAEPEAAPESTVRKPKAPSPMGGMGTTGSIPVVPPRKRPLHSE